MLRHSWIFLLIAIFLMLALRSVYFIPQEFAAFEPLRMVVLGFTLEALRMSLLIIIGAIFYHPLYRHCSSYPKVSVIIPAWNEEVGIGKAVSSVLKSDYPHLEIIVVNDGSSDGTQAQVEALIRAYPGRILLINNSHAGKGSALNAGVGYASGDIVINMDADSFIYTDTITQLVCCFNDPQVAAAVGNIVIGNRYNWIGKMQFYEYIMGFHLKRPQSIFNTIFILSGALCAYRKCIFEQTEGFRGHLCTEDMDFSLQLRQHNLRLVYAEKAICVTEGASELKGLLHQRTRWSYGALVCFRQHHNLFFNPTKSLIFSFYELPFAVIGYVQVLVYPVAVLLALSLPLVTKQYFSLFFILFSIMLNYTVVLLASGKLQKHVFSLLIIMPLLYCTMMVEHVALLRAIQCYFSKEGFPWTIWQRQGLDVQTTKS